MTDRIAHLEEAAELLRKCEDIPSNEFTNRRADWLNRDQSLTATTADGGKDHSASAQEESNDGSEVRSDSAFRDGRGRDESGLHREAVRGGVPAGSSDESQRAAQVGSEEATGQQEALGEPAPVAEAPERVTFPNKNHPRAWWCPTCRIYRGFSGEKPECSDCEATLLWVPDADREIARAESFMRSWAEACGEREKAKAERDSLRTQLTDANLKAEGLLVDKEELRAAIRDLIKLSTGLPYKDACGFLWEKLPKVFKPSAPAEPTPPEAPAEAVVKFRVGQRVVDKRGGPPLEVLDVEPGNGRLLVRCDDGDFWYSLSIVEPADPTPPSPAAKLGGPVEADGPPGSRCIPVYLSNDGQSLAFPGGGFTTVRACVHCGVLITGGPTACVHCVVAAEREGGSGG